MSATAINQSIENYSSEAAEEVRKDKEQDIRMICNARDIFKHLGRKRTGH